jgi:hypothetical protein
LKKLLLIAAAALLFGEAVFAEFTFSAGGRGVVNLFGIRFSDPQATTSGVEVPYNTDGPEVILRVAGVSPQGNIGVNLGISAASTNTDLLRPSNAKVWFKPFDWFKVTLGVFEEDTLRYRIASSGSGFGNYELYIRNDARDENTLFHRFKSSGFGTHIALTPVENLYIGAAFGSVSLTRSFTALTEDGALNVFKNIQVGAGYAIPGIGFLRVQYIGDRPFTNEAIRPNDNVPSLKNDAGGSYSFLRREDVLGNAAAFQGAFQLTAVTGLNIDIAASIPFLLEWDQGDPMYGRADPVMHIKSQRPYIMGIGFDVTLADPFRLYGRIDMETGAYKESTAIDTNYNQYEAQGTNKEGTDLLASLFVSYNFGNDWILGFDAALDSRSGDNRDAIPENAPDSARGGDTDLSLEVKRNQAYNNYVDLGFGLWVRRNIPNGDIRVAVTCKLPGVAGGAHKGAKPQMFFPVMFNYSF